MKKPPRHEDTKIKKYFPGVFVSSWYKITPPLEKTPRHKDTKIKKIFFVSSCLRGTKPPRHEDTKIKKYFPGVFVSSWYKITPPLEKTPRHKDTKIKKFSLCLRVFVVKNHPHLLKKTTKTQRHED
jgi:hypothetical protein